MLVFLIRYNVHLRMYSCCTYVIQQTQFLSCDTAYIRSYTEINAPFIQPVLTEAVTVHIISMITFSCLSIDFFFMLRILFQLNAGNRSCSPSLWDSVNGVWLKTQQYVDSTFQ